MKQPYVRGRFHRAHRRVRGFTFLEIMVVVVIMGILAAIVVPNFMGGVDDAKVNTTRVNIKNICAALELYKLDNNRYPTTEQGLQALVEKPTTDPVPQHWRHQYLPEVPLDGWQHPFTYVCPGPKSPYEVRSYGPDGVPDTADDLRNTDPADGNTPAPSN